MRICKPNDAGLVFGQGGPFSMPNLSGVTFSPTSFGPTAPSVQPSTPNSPSVGPISPNDPYASPPSVNSPSLLGGGQISPGGVTPGPDPQQGPGMNMCPNLGPAATGPTSEAPSEADDGDTAYG